MRVVEMIQFWARTTPHRPAIIQSEMVTTYQGLGEAIKSIGERIDRLNLNKHEPVAVCLANPSFMLATAFALMRGGYGVAPVNTSFYPHLAGAGLRNLIYDTAGQVTSGGRNIRFDMSWLPEPKAKKTEKPSHRPLPAENVDTVFFTSGTTGLPKKIVQPAAALDRLLQYPFTCASGNHQKILVMPGLASTFGFNRVCEILNVGKTACFGLGVEGALSLIDLFGIELVVASAAQALSLAETKQRNPAYLLGALKTVIIGGGKLEPQAMRRVSADVCRNVLIQYGSTEAGVAALAPFDAIAAVPDAVGIPLPWTEIQIVDEIGRVLQPGAEGLIRYRTPQLAENIKAAGPEISGVRDGWFYPGDIGSLTRENVLRLVGRSSDVINRGGIKVSAARIEEILKALPGIKDAAACGVIGPSGLEEVWVAIVSEGPVETAKIKTHVSECEDVRLAPDEIFTFDEIPRGELGKVQKYRLKEQMLSLKHSG